MTNSHPRLAPKLAAVRAALARFSKGIHGRGLPVDVVLIDDPSIARLAGRFRGSPRPTDVLAFGYAPSFASGGGEEIAGEVFVSLDTAKRQALERRAPIGHELLLLIVHGMLHLSGIDDETREGWLKMRRAEFEAMMQIL